MSTRVETLIQTSLLAALLVTSSSAAERRYIVHLPGETSAATVAGRHGLTLVRSLTGSGSGIHVFNAPAGRQGWLVLQGLTSDPSVLAAEDDTPVTLPGINAAVKLHPSSAPAPTLPLDGTLRQYFSSLATKGYTRQPAAGIIRVDDVQEDYTGAGVTVAVIDTGADFSQQVLAASFVQGWDFVNGVTGGAEAADRNPLTAMILAQETTPILDQETTPILDGGSAIILTQETTPILDQETTPILDGTHFPAYGHGTMVAGLVHLVAPEATILPVRVFAADGSSTVSQIVAGIYWAVDHGAQVLNMSFSTTMPSDALQSAIQYAMAKGVICVAAAGNDGQAEVVYPGSYQGVLNVASVANQDVRSLFSNYGPTISLAAPGEGLVTTYPANHYAIVWGTSFSAPLVSGGAALLIGASEERNPTADQVRDALGHAVSIGQELGAGQLDLQQAIRALPERDDE